MADILKVAAVLAAIIYLNSKAKSRVSTTNHRIMNTGLGFLLVEQVFKVGP